MVLLSKQTLKAFLLNENTQIALIYLIAFCVPFLFKQPQLLIGSIVNFLLILSVARFGIKKIIPLVFIPSISSFLNGVLFGTFTPYLIYMIPFIAMGNLIYVFSFKYSRSKFIRVILSSLLKASFLFSCTYILVNTLHIPQIFLTTMGAIQLFTALVGGIFAEILIAKFNRLMYSKDRDI
jgi:hypothetical protein